MTSPPDKIFRDGLGQYQKKAPPSAWDRIENNLDHKKNHVPWMKIAAGLVLVIATAILIWQQDQAVPALSQESLVNSKQLTSDSLKSLQSNSIAERSRSNQSHAANENLPVVERSRNEPSSSRGHGAEGKGLTEKSMEEVQLVVENDSDTKTLDFTPKAQPEITNEIASDEVVTDIKRTNITYSADEVNAKFLKKEIPTEATPEKKNASGIQKVIAVALVLYEEPLVGELREKKNEWLSINTSPKKRDINK